MRCTALLLQPSRTACKYKRKISSRATQTPANGSRTPMPAMARKVRHRPQSSASSLSQSISDDLGHLNIVARASGDPGQTASARVGDAMYNRFL